MSPRLDAAIETVAHKSYHRRLFTSLGENREKGQPYDADLAEQRAQYGSGLIRRLQAARVMQAEFEEAESAKHAVARQARAEQRARQEAVEVSWLLTHGEGVKEAEPSVYVMTARGTRATPKRSRRSSSTTGSSKGGSSYLAREPCSERTRGRNSFTRTFRASKTTEISSWEERSRGFL